jgi:hypothetical protein
MKIKCLATLLASVMAAGFVNAEEADTSLVKWNKVSATYVTEGSDDSDGLSLSGLSVGGSYLLNDSFFAYAGYSSVSDEYSYSFFSVNIKGEVSLSSLGLGLGFKHTLTPNWDVFASAGFISQTAEVTASVEGYGSYTESTDANGTDIEIGFVTAITNALQVKGAYSVTNLEYDGGSDSEDSFNLSADYLFNENFAINAGISTDGDTSIVGIGASYFF